MAVAHLCPHFVRLSPPCAVLPPYSECHWHVAEIIPVGREHPVISGLSKYPGPTLAQPKFQTRACVEPRFDSAERAYDLIRRVGDGITTEEWIADDRRQDGWTGQRKIAVVETKAASRISIGGASARKDSILWLKG